MELGIMFRDGKYLPPDREKAFHWFEQGAEWKDPYSMAALADMLLEGCLLYTSDEITARVIKVDSIERRIGLSIKAVNYDTEQLLSLIHIYVPNEGWITR